MTMDESSSLTKFPYQRQEDVPNNMNKINDAPIDSSLPKEQEVSPSNNGGRVKKILIAVCILSIIIFAIVDSQTNQYIKTGFENFLDWTSSHLVGGAFALVAVYAIATVAFIPGAVLTIGSGFVYGNALGLGWGVALASAVVFVGASTGAIVSFLLGRYLMREWVGERFVERYPVIKALDEAMKHQGLKIFTLIRLSPIIPFNVINYIGGVTAISLKHYCLALFGIIPGTVLYCFIGASAGSLVDGEDGAANSTVKYVGIGVGIVLGLLAVFVMSHQAKKEFNKIVALQEQETQRSEEDGSMNPDVIEETV